MRIAVVGAGAAGLAAARTLVAAGAEAIVFEKSDRVGGRIGTRRKDGFVYDTGASSIAPRGREIERVMKEELPHEDLQLIGEPVYTLRSMRVEIGDPLRMRIDRYTYPGGNQVLPERLAQGLNVKLNSRIREVSPWNGGATVDGVSFDGAILTAPIPQTLELLGPYGESRPIAHARYRSCLSVFLGFAKDLPHQSYHALIEPEQRHPLTWISIESQKATHRAPSPGTAIVAQLSPEYSRSRFQAEDADIVRDTLDYLKRLYGETLGDPVSSDVKRWRYSQPEAVAMFDSANPPGSRVLIAGDGLLGGRVELAYETGVMAARRLLE